ncbi:hypothetical protein ACHZ97_04335 [Lysobacter soli]|uniref:hypothetical protein n=1 Tax=Lysobacter soli TaxID=453783 RepID=UPI0037CB0A1F
MKLAVLLIATLAMSGCVASVKDLASDPSTPQLTVSFNGDWRSTYQAISAASLQCDAKSIRSAEDTATSTGTITSVLWERVAYVITVKPAPSGGGARVTVLMPMHETKQRQTWPRLLDLWVNQNDRTTCPADIWRG